jgi:hypothetical protein
MSRPQEVQALVARLTDALGAPVRDRARGLHRWRCPICGGGHGDPLGLYRPLVVSDDGWVVCEASLRRGYVDDETCPFTLDRLAIALREIAGGAR